MKKNERFATASHDVHVRRPMIVRMDDCTQTPKPQDGRRTRNVA